MKTTAHKGLIVGGPFLLAITLMTGCGGGGASPAASAPTVTKTVPGPTVTVTATPTLDSTEGDDGAIPDDTSTTPDDSTADSSSDEIGAFGDKATYDGGLVVEVAKPKAYTRSSSASGAENYRNSVVVTITVTNGTKKAFDPSMGMASASSGGEEAEEIFDSAKGLNGTPDTKVLPGKTVSWKSAFNVKDAKHMTFEFAPDFDSQSSIWTNDK